MCRTKAELKELLAKIINTPLVADTGTSGIWTYRKWSNGIAECWGKSAPTQKSVTNSYGNGFYAPIDAFAYPSNLFVQIDQVQASLIDSSASGKWFEIQTENANEVRGYVWGIASNVMTSQVSIYATGKWK